MASERELRVAKSTIQGHGVAKLDIDSFKALKLENGSKITIKRGTVGIVLDAVEDTLYAPNTIRLMVRDMASLRVMPEDTVLVSAGIPGKAPVQKVPQPPPALKKKEEDKKKPAPKKKAEPKKSSPKKSSSKKVEKEPAKKNSSAKKKEEDKPKSKRSPGSNKTASKSKEPTKKKSFPAKKKGGKKGKGKNASLDAF